MKINRIEITNFRGIHEYSVDLPSRFTVILGENGSGKTSILSAISRLLSLWVPEARKEIEPGEVRSTWVMNGVHPRKGIHYPASVRALVHDPGLPHTTSVALSRDADGPFPKMIQKGLFHFAPDDDGAAVDYAWYHLRQRARDAARDEGIVLPLVASFSPWREPPRKARPKKRSEGVPSRLEGYDECLDLHSDLARFVAWFKRFEMAAQQQLPDAVAQSATEGIPDLLRGILPGCTTVRYSARFDEVLVWFEGKEGVPVWQLADGHRTFLALATEIAVRATLLNPQFGVQAWRQTPGIVLIDELDLHLHPTWQRRVVSDLRHAFPNLQFIATTHSPFIVQSLKAEDVINLGDGLKTDYWRKGIEDIAEDVMGVPDIPRSVPFCDAERAAANFFTLLADTHRDPALLARARQEYEALVARFSDDPAYVALLKAEAAASGLMR